ncbi:MAG: hypothetical protein ACI8P9_000420 [Parasphingorhabdus sp.]|jgi:hypothetical protein
MLGRIFLWSWVVTLPITIMGGYWLYATLDRFHTFAVRYTGTEAGEGSGMELTAIGQYEFDMLWQRIRAEKNRLLGNESTLKPVRLYIPESDIKALESYLPQSGYQNVKGAMLADGKLLKVKYRYRGDSVYRWAWYKKSLRVKTSKKRLYEGMRTFNLLAARSAEQLNNYFSYQLANMMGLIAPTTELVRVYLNGKDRGVHFQVEQIEEVFLRNRGLMPGDIYRGEMVGKDRFVGGNVESLFDSIAGWDKVTVNNHYAEDSFAPLEKLISLLKAPNNPAIQNELSKFLDMDAWGSFSVFESLAQSTHMDDTHNWRLYYDPWRQKFLPVVWDTMGWYNAVRSGKLQPLSIPNTLISTLFRNGDFIRARHKALLNVFDNQIDKNFLRLVNDTIEVMQLENKTDPFLRPTDPVRVKQAMHELGRLIRASFELIDYRNSTASDLVEYHFSESNLDLKFSGIYPIDRIKLTFDRPVPEGGQVLAHFNNPEPNVVDVSGLTFVNDRTVEIHASLLPDFAVEPIANSTSNRRASSFDIDPGVMRFEFVDLDANTQLNNLATTSNHIQTTSTPVDSITSGSYRTLHFPIEEKPLSKPLRWNGEMLIGKSMDINQDLYIAPGTTIRLAAGVSVVTHGKVIAEGNSQEIIRFIPAATDDEPWGTFSIQGRGADGSQFSHCEFSGGSGLKTDLYEYSALFSVHNVKQVKISDCTFKNNAVVDDMLHGVYSDIVFDRVTFQNAISDALDLDNSVATISHSLFDTSGNDGIDLMTTEATVIDSTIVNNGDKGISVGEGSRLTGINNRVSANKIGVQSKDRSTAILFNNTLSDNEVALHVYRKNWQYGTGGQIFAAKSVIESQFDSVPVLAEKRSSIGLFDNFTNHSINSIKVFSQQVDDQNRSSAAQQTLLFDKSVASPEIQRAIHALSKSLQDKISTSRRGISQHD